MSPVDRGSRTPSTATVPAADDPVLRRLLQQADDELVLGTELSEVLFRLAVAAWFEGGTQARRHLRR